MGLVGQIVNWFSSIDWKPETVTAAATITIAALTFILASGTLFLWLATKRMVKGGERTAERELRAYVFIKDGAVRTDQGQFSVAVVLKNFGQTPATDFSTWSDCGVYPSTISRFQRFQRPPTDEPGPPSSARPQRSRSQWDSVLSGQLTQFEKTKALFLHGAELIISTLLASAATSYSA
jgi:hypothetical protein